MRRTPALIAGGGPAGAAAAITLAAAGARPLVLERDRETGDALCGGFLSWRTLASLEALGLDTDRLAGERIAAVRLFAGSGRASAALPAPGRGVSRRRLDAMLLARAGQAGAAVERGVAIRHAGEALRLQDGATLHADALFLATGKHDLRGLARPRGAAGRDPAVGLRLRLAPSPLLRRMLAGAIELHLFDGGYAGLLLQEDGSANLCMAVRRSRLAAAGGRPATLIERIAGQAPALADRLAATPARSPVEAIAHIPYGWRARSTTAGVFRLGDQGGVIPSLAGEGIGIALASGRLAARAWLREGPIAASSYQVNLAARLRRPLGLAGLLLALAERPALAGPLVALAARLPRLIDPIARATRIDAEPLIAGAPLPIFAP